jgi:hypothetical protein
MSGLTELCLIPLLSTHIIAMLKRKFCLPEHNAAETPFEGTLLSRQTPQIFRRHCNLAAKTGVLADVVELGRLLRMSVELRFDALPVGRRPVVVLVGPDGRVFHDQRFTIRIELVGHGE